MSAPPPLEGPLHLVEPTLAGEAGHQLSFAESLWTAAAGAPVVIWTGRGAAVPRVPPWVAVERHFARRWRKLQALLLYRRLLRAPGRVVVATATRLDLLLVAWAAGRTPLPPGKVHAYVHWWRDSASKRRTLERLARRHPGLVILGPTPGVVEPFRRAGFPHAAVVPYPISPARGTAASPRPFTHLVFAGAARQDKGFGRFVDLVALLAAEGAAWPVVFQRAATPERYDEATRRDLARLDGLAYPGLRTVAEPLPAEAYAALFPGGVCVQPYHPGDFADRVSGVTLDALSSGCPVVAVAGTWTARVVERFGAGEVVPDDEAATLRAAVGRVVAGYAGFQAAARAAGAALREENDGRRLWAAVTGGGVGAPHG